MQVIRVELRGRDRVPNFAAWYRYWHTAGYRIWIAADESHAIATRLRPRRIR